MGWFNKKTKEMDEPLLPDLPDSQNSNYNFEAPASRELEYPQEEYSSEDYPSQNYPQEIGIQEQTPNYPLPEKKLTPRVKEIEELPELPHESNIPPPNRINQNQLPRNQYEPQEIKQAVRMPPTMQRSRFPPLSPSPTQNHQRNTPTNTNFQQPSQRPLKKEPVYIRLDKFEMTSEALEDIKKKIIDIEDLLKNIKRIKEEEEKELEEWEKEIGLIKSRIDSIDNEVFSQLN